MTALLSVREPTSWQIQENKIYQEMGVTDEEYLKICDFLGRLPNYVEIGVFSVMWSEHCSYKKSKPLLKKFPVTAPHVLVSLGEGAGIVDIGDNQAIAFKIESHNHPSAIEPYQGAATGVGGIIRDIFSMGARPIALLNSLRFGNLKENRVKYLFENVVAGIAGYGNCIGIPTVGGEVMFHECYEGNPLVNVMCVGLMEHAHIQKGIAKGIGNPVFYVGPPTGRDGIHGATFASDELTEESDAKRSAVQVGDPFMEKLVMEACLELIYSGIVVGIQDMGAAGLTCSSAEMASKAGNGMELYLDLVPQREEGMTPYEMMLSESQERMLFVIKEEHEEQACAIFHKFNLPCVKVGKVTDNGRLRLIFQGEIVGDMPITGLVDESPVYKKISRIPEYYIKNHSIDASKCPEVTDLTSALKSILSSPTVASKEWIYNQYDYMVRTETAVIPGSDAAVINVPGTRKALAMTTDCNSRYVYLDPEMGGKIAVAEAGRNLICSGSEPLAVTDNLNFGNPDKPEVFWQMEKATDGIAESCRYFEIPIISGNVSLYNENVKEAIFPTPVIGMVGLIRDRSHITTQGFKNEGDIIVLLGETKPEIGGSEFQYVMHGEVAGSPPVIDLEVEKRLQETVLSAIQQGLVNSAHDLSEGGLGLALAESCFSGGKGANIFWKTDLRLDLALFSESQSRILLTVSKEKFEALKLWIESKNVPFEAIGEVSGKDLRITINEKLSVNVPIRELIQISKNAIPSELKKASSIKEKIPLWSGDFYNEGVALSGGLLDKLNEECGIFAVFGHPEASTLSYYGLHALQHRGQESAGICSTDGRSFNYFRNMGLAKEVFTKDILPELRGSNAIAQVRYSTSGESKLSNAQPLVFKYREGDLAIATNGNLDNAKTIKREFEKKGSIFQTTSDTEVLAHLIARSKHDDIVEAAKEALNKVIGGYAFLIMTKDKLLAARDPNGLRPFMMGSLEGAYLFASESSAIDAVGGKFIRDVEPGEILILDSKGLREERFIKKAKRSICAMEYIYFARPDSDIDGINIHSARKRMGKQLAKESFVEADVVTGVPDSSISAAIGYAEEAGIPYELGLIKNRYTGRTFIQPSQDLREQGVKMKLSAVRKVVEGKKVIMIDDSIVRGTTSLRIVSLLRAAGAKEVHVRISSPPFRNPCYYGIDTPNRKELIAADHSIEEIRRAINADSLHFLSEEGLLNSIGEGAAGTESGYCMACFNNEYPTLITCEGTKKTKEECVLV